MSVLRKRSASTTSREEQTVLQARIGRHGELLLGTQLRRALDIEKLTVRAAIRNVRCFGSDVFWIDGGPRSPNVLGPTRISDRPHFADNALKIGRGEWRVPTENFTSSASCIPGASSEGGHRPSSLVVLLEAQDGTSTTWFGNGKHGLWKDCEGGLLRLTPVSESGEAVAP